MKLNCISACTQSTEIMCRPGLARCRHESGTVYHKRQPISSLAPFDLCVYLTVLFADDPEVTAIVSGHYTSMLAMPMT